MGNVSLKSLWGGGMSVIISDPLVYKDFY